MTANLPYAIIMRQEKNRAAGRVILSLGGQDIQLSRNENAVHGHLQNVAERIEIVDGRQIFAALPFVDGASPRKRTFSLYTSGLVPKVRDNVPDVIHRACAAPAETPPPPC